MVEKKKTTAAKAKATAKPAAKKPVAKTAAKAAAKPAAKKTAPASKAATKKPVATKAVASKPAVKKTTAAKKPVAKKAAEVKQVAAAPKVEARPVVKAKEAPKACKCSCGGKAILFLIIVAVVVAGLYWLWCCTSSPKANFLSTCQKSEAECVCMADYLDENLTKAEFDQAIVVLTADKPEQYLVAGIFTGDKIAQVVTRGTLLCMKE